jgi:hypothetical protein
VNMLIFIICATLEFLHIEKSLCLQSLFIKLTGGDDMPELEVSVAEVAKVVVVVEGSEEVGGEAVEEGGAVVVGGDGVTLGVVEMGADDVLSVVVLIAVELINVLD